MINKNKQGWTFGHSTYTGKEKIWWKNRYPLILRKRLGYFAIIDIFHDPQNYQLDCGTAMSAIQAAAVALEDRKTFERMLGENEGGLHSIRNAVTFTKDGRDDNDWVPGDSGHVKNNNKPKDNFWCGEFVTYLGNKKWYGFPIGILPLRAPEKEKSFEWFMNNEPDADPDNTNLGITIEKRRIYPKTGLRG